MKTTLSLLSVFLSFVFGVCVGSAFTCGVPAFALTLSLFPMLGGAVAAGSVVYR